MKIVALYIVVTSIVLCKANSQSENENYLTKYSKLESVNLTQLTNCMRNVSSEISANITVDAYISPRTRNMIFDVFADIMKYGEVRDNVANMTSFVNKRVRVCLEQQGFKTSLQVWLLNKENTKKKYPSGYCERFGSVQIFDTRKINSTTICPMNDDEQRSLQVKRKTKKANPASSKGHGVGTIHGLNILLYSGAAYVSRMLYRKNDLICGEGWSVPSTVGSGAALTNQEKYEARLMVWPHHCCRSETKRGKDKEESREIDILKEYEQEIQGRVG